MNGIPIDGGGCQAPVCGVGPLAVIERHPPRDARLGLRAGFPSVQVDAFVFERAPEAYHKFRRNCAKRG